MRSVTRVKSQTRILFNILQFYILYNKKYLNNQNINMFKIYIKYVHILNLYYIFQYIGIYNILYMYIYVYYIYLCIIYIYIYI